MGQISFWQRFKRRFSRYGKLDQQMLGWRRYRHGEITAMPNGEEMVYEIKPTVLEIGNATSKIFALGAPVLSFGVFVWVLIISEYPEMLNRLITQDENLFIMILDIVLLFILIPMGTLLAAFLVLIMLGQFIGYTDIPLRFDRKRRMMHQWTSRGVISVSWDKLTPVVQEARAAPHQMNKLYSMLLVEFDETGELPKYTRGMPHIFNIGSPALHPDAARGRYAYVERFMTIGPNALPAVGHFLRHRPRWYEWFNSLGVIDMWSTPEKRRFYGGMRFVMIPLGLIAWPLYVFSVLAQWTTRVPKWPKEIADLHAADVDETRTGEVSPSKSASAKPRRKPVIRVNGELVEGSDLD